MKSKGKWFVVVLAACLVLGAGGFWLLSREGEPRLDVISRKDALEDYDYLWETLEENYPFFGVAERKYRLDVQQMKQEYRQQLEGMGKEIDFLEFYQLMEECMGRFNGLGHLTFYSTSIYCQEMAGAEYLHEYKLGGWRLKNILMCPNVYLRYQFLESIAPSNWTEKLQSERLELNNPQDNVAYMKINSFEGSYIKQDQEKILSFFKKNIDIPYFIIDIRGNGGGSIGYWYENIVAPNITETESAPFLCVMADGEEAQKQMEINGWPVSEFSRQIDELKFLPKVSQDDLVPGWYWRDDLKFEVKPLFNEKIYQGKILLLVDGGTCSAADSFAYFCKETGFATVLGQENTHGSGPGSEYITQILPHSSLLFRYRPVLALDMDGASIEEFGVAPDVLLPTRAKNSNDKISPLAACLSYIDELEERKD